MNVMPAPGTLPREIARPEVDEYSPYYAPYLELIPEGDVREYLEEQRDRLLSLLWSIPEDRWAHRYAEGKWSVREVVGHMIDTERIMSYRALRVARNDATPLAGFEENAYAPESGAEARSMGDLANEIAAVRAATIALFRSLPLQAWLRRGTANAAPISTRALAWIIAGHTEHHMRVLQQRYLR